MNFDYSEKVLDLIGKLNSFMDENIYPNEAAYAEHFKTTEDKWKAAPIMSELKSKARDAGLWNLFLPDSKNGAGLNNLEYAPLAEIMGRAPWCSEAFNCSAPDTGNMEVLDRYGTDEQKAEWLNPLLNGEIRSVFCMTEPAVASSDATNIESPIIRDGDNYVINGRKWWSSGAMNEDCKLIIFMGKTDPDNPSRHKQQSMILVPMDSPGVNVIRPLSVFGGYDYPHGHAEVEFKNVKVPVDNMLLGEGRGFEIAQGRLGPGRIHHCMRLIGAAQRSLEFACKRVNLRSTFGKKLAEHQSVREEIAKSFAEIEQARQLTLLTAKKMDEEGAKNAKDLIAASKITVPLMAQNVIDRCMQVHGAGGLTQDYFMAEAFNYARWCRQADGPDQVHMMALGKEIIKRYSD